MRNVIIDIEEPRDYDFFYAFLRNLDVKSWKLGDVKIQFLLIKLATKFLTKRIRYSKHLLKNGDSE